MKHRWGLIMQGLLGVSAMLAVTAVDGQAPIPSNAPRPITLYYNEAMEITTPEKAAFTRQTMLDFENIEFSGVTKDYNKAKTLISEGYYDHGVNKGLHTEYHDDGKVSSTIEYADDGFIIWELVNSTGEHLVKQGFGKFTISCFAVEASANGRGVSLQQGTVSGEFQLGKRVGRWEYISKGGVKTDDEYYEKGAFVRRDNFLSGSVVTYDSKKNIIISLEDILAETFQFDAAVFPTLQQFFEQYGPALPADYHRAITFPGGMKKLLLIIASSLSTEITDNVVVRLIVDEKGKFVKVKASLLLPGLGDELTEIIKPHAGKLLPAITNGKPVTSALRIPVSNSPQWIKYLESVPDDDVNAYIDQLNQAP